MFLMNWYTNRNTIKQIKQEIDNDTENKSNTIINLIDNQDQTDVLLSSSSSCNINLINDQKDDNNENNSFLFGSQLLNNNNNNNTKTRSVIDLKYSNIDYFDIIKSITQLNKIDIKQFNKIESDKIEKSEQNTNIKISIALLENNNITTDTLIQIRDQIRENINKINSNFCQIFKSLINNNNNALFNQFIVNFLTIQKQTLSLFIQLDQFIELKLNSNSSNISDTQDCSIFINTQLQDIDNSNNTQLQDIDNSNSNYHSSVLESSYISDSDYTIEK